MCTGPPELHSLARAVERMPGARTNPMVNAGVCSVSPREPKTVIGAPVHKFSKRHMLIFVACLVVGTILIGVGMAYVIRVKQRIFPSSPTNASLTRSDAPLRACRCARLSLTAYSILESRGSDSRGSDIVLSESRELHHVTHNPRYRFTRPGYACCAVLATLFDSVKVISKTPLVRRSV
jgi:hypothetical protein